MNLIKFLMGIFFLPVITWGAETSVFRFSLFIEPHTLDPARFSSSGSSYFMSNLFQGLYRFDDKRGLVPTGAKSCLKSSPNKITCILNQKSKWTSGEVVVAEDYVRAFQHFIDPNTKSKETSLLLNLKNAKDTLTPAILKPESRD